MAVCFAPSSTVITADPFETEVIVTYPVFVRSAVAIVPSLDFMPVPTRPRTSLVFAVVLSVDAVNVWFVANRE